MNFLLIKGVTEVFFPLMNMQTCAQDLIKSCTPCRELLFNMSSSVMFYFHQGDNATRETLAKKIK